MTPAVKKLSERAADIIQRAAKHDSGEDLHIAEDELMAEALTLIKNTSSDPRARDIARIGLSTENTKFSRWYS